MKQWIMVFCICMMSMPVRADLPITPGLWEYDVEIKVDGKTFDPHAEMKKILDNMPADQRAAMEQMMKQSGSEMPSPSGPQEQCITEQDIKKDIYYRMDEMKDCTFGTRTKKDNQYKTDFSCTKQGTTMDGTMEITVINAKKYRVQTTSSSSKGQTIKATYDSRFLKSDCGSSAKK